MLRKINNSIKVFDQSLPLKVLNSLKTIGQANISGLYCAVKRMRDRIKLLA